MAEKISVQIALEGGDKVEKQLGGIADAGQEMAAGLTKAGEASSTTAQEVEKTGEAADKAAESFRGLTLETVKTSSEIAKNVAEIAKQGVEIGLTIQRHRGWIGELLHLASSANTAVKAIGLFTPELAAMGTALVPVVGGIAAVVVGFEVLEKAATKAAKGYEQLNHSLQTLASNTEQSFDSLQRGQAAFGQLGISADKFGGIITKISETLGSFDPKVQETFNQLLESEKAMLEAQIKLQDLGGSRVALGTYERLAQITQQLELATGDLAKAEADAAAKADAFAKASANGLEKLLPIVRQIEEGQKGLTFDSLVTAESKIRAVTASMKEAENSGKAAGQVLVQFVASADRLTAIKVGAAFGITEADVDRIRSLGGQLGVVDQIWQRIQSAGVLIPPESAAAFDQMRDSIVGADAAYVRFQQSLQSSAFAALAADASRVLNDIKAGFFNAAAAVVETFNQVASSVSNVVANTRREFETLGSVLTPLGSALVQVFTDPMAALNNLIAGVQTLIDKFLVWLRLKGGGAPAASGGGSTPGMAAGGLLGGRGTGTSDSNLAWVSRGEYITPARAVAQPGVLAFLEALRRSGGNLSRVLDGMGRFALGGMVPRMPAFATGGLAGGSHVTIQFPGLPAIGGLRASSDVVDQLHRAAALAQVRSGGRKPSRYS